MRRVAFRVGLFLLFFIGACGGGGGGGTQSTGNGALAPLVTTQPATGVTPTGAVLNASVNPNGEATQIWFEYGTDSTLSSHTASPTQAIGGGLAGVPVNFGISGLAGARPTTTASWHPVPAVPAPVPSSVSRPAPPEPDPRS